MSILQAFADQGYAAYAIDLRGYGETPRDATGWLGGLPTTQVGDINLLIPKLRAGSFLPSILEPRRRVDQARYAVITEAYINGVSTRKVDALVAALGSQSGISKSQVSR
jgi:transposase-like protein